MYSYKIKIDFKLLSVAEENPKENILRKRGIPIYEITRFEGKESLCGVIYPFIKLPS